MQFIRLTRFRNLRLRRKQSERAYMRRHQVFIKRYQDRSLERHGVWKKYIAVPHRESRERKYNIGNIGCF